MVVFDTGKRFKSIKDLAKAVGSMSTGSIFYHFIEARRRPPLEEDDFTAWLLQWGDETERLRSRLKMVDYYYWTLHELRDQVSKTMIDFMEEGE